MSEPGNDQSTSVWPGLAGVGAIALAIGCCGVLPLAVVLASSVALGTFLGVSAGIVALIALVGVILVLARRRSACETPDSRSQGGEVGEKREAL